MKYSHELLHKPIISADKNEKMGRIHGYVLDPEGRRVAAFVLEQLEGEQSFFVVPFSATKSIYTDAVIVENLPGPLPLNEAPQLMELLLKDIALIGAQVITETGMLAGAVKDFSFSERTGDIETIRINPEQGFPATIEISKIIKIARDRVMASRTIYDPKAPAHPPKPTAPKLAPPAPAPAPAPEKPTAPPREPHEHDRPEFIAAPEPTPEPPAHPSAYPPAEPDDSPESQTPRVDAIRNRIFFDQFRKEMIADVETLYNSIFKEQLRVNFQEAVRLLLDRMNSLEPDRHFEKLRGQMTEEIERIVAETAAGQTKQFLESASGQATQIEEKLKGKVASRIDAAEARVQALEKGIAGLSEQNEILKEKISVGFAAGAAEIKALAEEELRKTSETVEKFSLQVAAALEDIKQAAPTAAQFSAMLDNVTAEMKSSVGDIEARLGASVSAPVVELISAKLDSLENNASIGEEIKRLAAEADARNAAALKSAEEKIESGIQSLRESAPAAGRLEELLGEIRAEMKSSAGGIGESVDAAMDANMSKLGKRLEDTAARLGAIEDRVSSEIADLRADLAGRMPELIEKYSQQAKLYTDQLSLRVPSEETVARGMRELGGEITSSLDKLLAKHTDELRKKTESIAHDVSSLGRLDKSIENMRAEISAKMPELMDRQIEEFKALATAIANRIPAAGQFDEIQEKLKQEFAITLPSLFARQLEEIRKQTDTLAEKIPDAGAFDRTADKLKYELSLILPELLQKNFEDIKHRTEAVAEKIPDAAALEQAARDSADKLHQSIAAMKFDLEAAYRNAAAPLAEKLDAIENSVSGGAEKSEESRKKTAEMIEAISISLESRFRTLRTQVEDLFGAEFSRHADTETSTRDETGRILQKIRESITGLGEEMKKLDPAGVKTDILNEMRALTDAAVKSEDFVGLKQWIESSTDKIAKSIGGEAKEQMDAAVTAMNRLAEEAAVDFGQIKHDAAAIGETLSESLRSHVAAETSKLSGQFEQIHGALRSQVTDETSKLAGQFDQLQGTFLSRVADETSKLAGQFEQINGTLRSQVADETSKLAGQFEQLHGTMREAFASDEKTQGLASEAALAFTQAAEILKSEIENLKGGVRNVADNVEQSIAETGKRETLAKQVEDYLGGRVEDLAQSAARIERDLRESHGVMREHIDRRIGERDDRIEDAFQRIASALEDLINRPQNAGLGDIFSGGLFNIFGSTKAAPSKRIMDSAAPKKKSPGASGPVEASQVRRLSYLIGKKLMRDITDASGNIIASYGDTVDEQTITTCRDNHKILDLIRAVDLA